MTSDHNHNEPSRESNEHVLSHYFDELLPAQSEEEPSQNDSPIEELKETLQPELSTDNPDDNSDPIAKPEPDIERDDKHCTNTLSSSVSHASEPLAALKEETSVSTQTDGAAYEAHKQRLEQMLKQLTPVKSVPLAPSDIATLATESLINPTEVQTEDAVPLTEPDAIGLELSLTNTQPLSREWLDNGRPHWAQEPFDILLIDVNGLKLAVPLIALGHIEPIKDELTPLFGQSKWFLGLQKTPFGNIKTIDTAEYVMPERSFSDDNKDYQFVVSISGMDWGLAVDNIDQPTLIDPEAIRWRAKRENRPWMAGTVKDHMCVLLDIPVLGEILQKEDQNNPKSTGE